MPTNAGTYAITADFTPTDATNYNTLSSANAGSFVIEQAGTPTLSVTNSPVTYNGAPQAATVSGSVPGTSSNIKYNGTSTVPTDAGTYVITADFTPADTTNYDSRQRRCCGQLHDSEGGDDDDGDLHGRTVHLHRLAHHALHGRRDGCGRAEPGAGGQLRRQHQRRHRLGGCELCCGSVNHLGSSDAKTFTIAKATPTLSVTNSPVTYNGSPQAAAVVGSVLGTVGNIQYNGSSTAPTNAGTYAITADFTPADATNYNTLSSANAGSFVIEQAGTPTLSVTNSPVTYNGAPQAAAVSGSVLGTMGNIKYNDSSTVPTDAGTYVITADFTPTDTTNYSSVSGASAGSFVINKAATTTAVTCTAGPFTYTGAGIEPCAAGVTGAGGLNQALAVTYAGNVDAGTATATASYAGSANHLASTDSDTFIIGEATITPWLYLPYASH